MPRERTVYDRELRIPVTADVYRAIYLLARVDTSNPQEVARAALLEFIRKRRKELVRQ